VDEYLNQRLTKDLENGLLKSYLELDPTEMKDNDIAWKFQQANALAGDSLKIFVNLITILRESTSILARLATMRSLTNERSWPILIFAAFLPVSQYLLRKILPPRSQHRYHHSMDLPSPTFVIYFLIPPGFWFAGQPQTDEEWQLEYARKSLYHVANDRTARPELLIFGAHDWFIKRYNLVTELLLKAKEERKRQDGDYNSYHDLLANNLVPMAQVGLRALMYLIVAYQPNYFQMPLSQLNFVEGAIRDIFASITSLQWKVGDRIIQDMFKVRNLFECTDFKSNYSIPKNPKPYVPHPYGMKIEVKNMTFKYGKESDPVLEDINFTIERGQIVSIVGYNGSGKLSCLGRANALGKSTLIRLLTLLEKPTKGNIYINDIDVSEYIPKVVRTKMSVLFQDFRILQKISWLILGKYSEISAEENIAIGKGGQESSDVKGVRESAELTGAHEKIRSFHSYYASRLYSGSSVERVDTPDQIFIPGHGWVRTEKEIPFLQKILTKQLHIQAKVRDKYLTWEPLKTLRETFVEKSIPKFDPAMKSRPETVSAEMLSGGEWQKIAMARVFMKLKEADLLILDEPTSALDPQAEYELFKTLMEYRKNRTTIFIVLTLCRFLS